MKKIIWGTGMYGRRFAHSLGRDGFDSFIDRDRSKTSRLLLGKQVLNPDDLDEDDWKGSFFYIPFNYKVEIATFLTSKGLREGKDYRSYGAWSYCRKDEALEELEAYKVELQGLTEHGISTLFMGMTLPRRGYENVIRGLPPDMAVILEDMCGEDVWNEELLGHPVVKAPAFMDQFMLVRALRTYESDDDAEVEGKSYLTETVKKIEVDFEEADEGDCRLAVSLTYRFYLETLETLKPKNIICIGSVSSEHRILRRMCAERGINVVFTHPGVLPGTLAFDVSGEVGESLPALRNDKFNRLPISPQDMELASDIWNWLYKSGLNRKVQPAGGIPVDAEARIVKGRPTVLFMGQNDSYSYMVPYTEETRKYWSPVFKSSEEAASFLAGICEKNGWNFIYKPHPMYSHPEQAARLPANTIFIEFGNINDIIDCCDVAITIVSTANYIALIRKKPVVMLGYNQIRGKGCCYEAYEENRIEAAVKEALEKGFTEEQQRNFQTHIAQLVKYYLYDDMQPRELRYGKAAPKSFEDFYELNRLLLKDTKQEH
ncbi:MAG: hypothetical protein K6G18_12975 [Treponema sp.]|nr:hypothetical protein [Treponema sp.]